MTRRHDSLIPLSQDHHHALAQARRLEEAASMPSVAERRRAADDFVNFYLGRLLRHFREEEELFFAPLVDFPEARDLVMQVIAEHLRIHALVRALRRQLVSASPSESTNTTIPSASQIQIASQLRRSASTSNGARLAQKGCASLNSSVPGKKAMTSSSSSSRRDPAASFSGNSSRAEISFA